MILLFFHGASQDLAAVELDRGLISLTPLAGLGQESPPFRMINVGGHLVAGWGDIYATRISTREETHLGEATFALPAAEDDRVWMIHYSGGALGVGSRTVWQVGLDGRSLTEPVELPDDLGFALAGIPGGLALQTNAGLTLWYATSDDRPTLGDGDLARVLDSNENQLVWCTDPCDEVVVTTFPDLDSTLFPVPDGHVVFSGGYGHMAPNGIHIAALLRRSDDPGAVGATALWILDLLSGESVVRGASGEAQFFSWSPGGDHLFATSYSWMEGTRTNFWWYEMRSGDFLSTSREINGMLDVIAIYSIGLDEDLYFDPEFAQPFPRPD